MSVVWTALVMQNLLVHQPLDLGEFDRIECGVVREVEAQARRIDHAASLLDVRAEHGAQRGMEQVRRRVVAHRGAAKVRVDVGEDRIAAANRSGRDDFVNREPRNGRVGIFDFGELFAGTGEVEGASIAHLAAGFSVERRLIQHDFGLLAGADRINRLLALDDCRHAACGFERVVSEEFRAALQEQLLVNGCDGGRSAPFQLARARSRCCSISMWKPVGIDRETILARHLLLFLKRQSVGVVELEGDTAGQAAAAALRASSWKIFSATWNVVA